MSTDPMAEAAEVPMGETALPVEPTAPVAEPTSAVAEPAGPGAVPIVPAVQAEAAQPVRRWRLAFVPGLMRLGRLLFAVLLFAAGVVLGVSAFQGRQPASILQVPGDPSTNGIAAPAVVRELAGALTSNDTDQIRAAVPGSPYELLTKEIGIWSFARVTSVEVLSTFQDGTRSATEIILRGKDADGVSVLTNLIVHAEDGLIVNFR